MDRYTLDWNGRGEDVAEEEARTVPGPPPGGSMGSVAESCEEGGGSPGRTGAIGEINPLLRRSPYRPATPRATIMPACSRLTLAALALTLSACGEEKPPEYVSPTGFQPFTYRREGDRITYTMRDVIAEDGPFVRYVTKQQVAPGGPVGGAINYTAARSNCDKFVFQILGEGDTVAKMDADRPDDRWVEIVNGSSATAALVTACQVAKKLK
ncbi:hypothetical protein [Methylorubrum populi]|uniref:hypothetical protein n=1 Tax=Methylorubrum populi TaxID=223967 RepID=UPI002F35BB63